MRLKALLPALLGSAMLASVANAQSTEIKFGHVGEPGSLFDATAQEFARRANEKLGDEAEVVVYGSSQLGGDTELLKKLKLGTADLALPSTVMTTVAPEFGLFDMPYLVEDRDHAARIHEAVTRPTLVPIAEENGYRIIGIWENGFRHVTNSARPIETPEDLRGLKLRVPQGVWRVRMFEAYGASPSPLPLSETFVALQTGVMDAQENPLAQIYASRFQEVQKFLSLTGHVYTPAYVVAGRSWDRLPENVQQILIETAVEMEPVVRETAARMDEELIGQFEQAGMEINEVDNASFVDASERIYREFAEEVDGGQDLIDSATKAAKGS